MNEREHYPKISIVTPNYNKGAYLEFTIQSVLSQNYPNLEYIIIDGGSTDQSVDIIKKYEEHLSYWISEKDDGMYHALTKGFNHATGDIFAWIGSDDMYHPNAFFTVAEIFASLPQINWLVGATSIIDKNSRTVYARESRYFSRTDLLSGDFRWIQQESSFWKAELYKKANGLNKSLRYAGDFDLWVKFTRFDKMYISDSLIGAFRMSGRDQLSLNQDSYLKEVEDIVDEELSLYPTDLYNKKVLCFKKWLLRLISKIKVFNTPLLERYLMKSRLKERMEHKVHYNFKIGQFELHK